VFLEVKGLKKSYKKQIAVDGIDFSLNEGEIFGLLGPNGAGKSTTISMLAGLIKPSGGDITMEGRSILKVPNEIKKIMGLVPQEIALYPTLSARENLKFWGRMYGMDSVRLKERMDDVLRILGLTERADHRIDTYSGGMKRRINIGAALLHQPKLLIMDEPTVGIDPQSRKHILDMVLDLNRQGMTILYTSHYMEEVEYLCHRVAIMDRGRIIASGTKEELKTMVGDADKVVVEVENYQQYMVDTLRILEGVQTVMVEKENIIILVKDGRKRLADIVKVFNYDGCKVNSVSIREPDLEGVFLHLTGRALRD
jgi:ABC-2 type transport system ATP-binding protein